MIYLLMVPAMAAAIWAWRLAEASNARLKADLSVEKMNSSSWVKAHGKVCDELAELSERHAAVMHDLGELKKLHVEITANELSARGELRKYVTRVQELKEKTEALENEIEGLNVDKLYLKERLRKFEADAEKRREQKRAGMRRFRAKKREAKG